MSTAVASPQTVNANAVERVLIQGDLGKLSEEVRLDYYRRVCESLSLNPLTQPFEYITLNGKLRLYARKDCTDQLRKNYKVSLTITGREKIDDVYVVTARAVLPDGRTDESTGAVSVKGLQGDALANAMMKSETKSKRRVTLSICGLGVLDETEAETIPAHVEPVKPELTRRIAEPTPAKQPEQPRPAQQPPPKTNGHAPAKVAAHPANGAELLARLVTFETKLVEAKLCRLGELIDAVKDAGKVAGCEAKIPEWEGRLVDLGCAVARQFDAEKHGKPTAEATDEEMRWLEARVQQGGATWEDIFAALKLSEGYVGPLTRVQWLIAMELTEEEKVGEVPI